MTEFPDSISRNKSYLETVEESLGISLRPDYFCDIKLTVDDCIKLREDLGAFYTEHPFSSAYDPEPNEFSPVLTSDISQLRDATDSLASLSRAFDHKHLTPAANNISNLFLFARRTILSDPLIAFADMLEDTSPGRMPDADIVATLENQLRALSKIRDLVNSETVCFYYPAGHWLTKYEDMSDEMVMEVGLSSLPEFERWAAEELIPNEGLDDHLSTWGTMALMEMVESLSFCKLLGRNCGPVLGSDLAINAYDALLRSFPSERAGQVDDLKNAARLFSNAAIDARHLQPEHFAEVRFSSKAFEFWHGFMQESLSEIQDYDLKGRAFDARLQASFERRGDEFQRRLTQEFAGSSLADVMRLDQSNVIGFLTGVTGSVSLGSDIPVSAGLGAGAVLAEKIAAMLQNLTKKQARELLRSHYHALAPKTAIVKT